MTDKFPEDVDGVREGQLSVLEKATALGEKVTDPKSLQLWEDMMLKTGLIKQKVGIQQMIYETALK